VLSIVILDGSNQSIGHGSSIPIIESILSTPNILDSTVTNSENASPTLTTAVTSHKVLICSEEQFKVFRFFLFLCFFNLTFPGLYTTEFKTIL
jgi:hypothetical protein